MKLNLNNSVKFIYNTYIDKFGKGWIDWYFNHQDLAQHNRNILCCGGKCKYPKIVKHFLRVGKIRDIEL